MSKRRSQVLQDRGEGVCGKGKLEERTFATGRLCSLLQHRIGSFVISNDCLCKNLYIALRISISTPIHLLLHYPCIATLDVTDCPTGSSWQFSGSTLMFEV